MKFVNSRAFFNKRVNNLEIRLQRARLLSKPVYLVVEPTLQCNSFCVMCNRNAVRKGEDTNAGFLTWEILHALDPFFRWAEQVIFSGFGEPLLHKEFLPMLAHIKSLGPEVSFFTNGILLTPEISRQLLPIGLDRISISFGGATPETYRYVRGIEMDVVVENIRALHLLKKELCTKKPVIALNIVAMNSVLKELDRLIPLAASLGVEEITMPHLTVQRPDLAEESPWKDLDHAKKLLEEAYRRAKVQGISFKPPDLSHQIHACKALLNSFMVTWDGNILSCPLERYLFGSIPQESPAYVWNRPELEEIRKRVFEEGISKVCPNCFCWDNRAESYLDPHENSRRYAYDLRGAEEG